MKRRPLHSLPPCSNGFSVLELLIVLAIVVSVAAMAAPTLMSMVRESSVFREADKVREVLGEARRYAIDVGIDYEFRYEPNGASAVVLPSETELNVSDENTSTTTGAYSRALLELPEGMKIRADAGVEETSESLDPQRFGNLGGADLARRQWSAPVRFRFNGTSDDFTFRVSDESGLTSKITLRGLTGTARTSQVYPEEER